MKTKHTPEPWRLGRFSGPGSYEKVRETCGAMDVVVDTDTGPYVLAGCNINFPDDAKANARRIVACVNACAGLSTEFLEQIDSIQAALTGQLVVTEVLEKQRNELLAAINFARQGYQAASENGDHDEVEWAEMYLRSIDVAIASVKEKA